VTSLMCLTLWFCSACLSTHSDPKCVQLSTRKPLLQNTVQ